MQYFNNYFQDQISLNCKILKLSTITIISNTLLKSIKVSFYWIKDNKKLISFIQDTSNFTLENIDNKFIYKFTISNWNFP